MTSPRTAIRPVLARPTGAPAVAYRSASIRLTKASLAFAILTLAACSSSAPAGPVELPPQEVIPAPESGAVDGGASEVRYVLPSWQREDVQPQSPRFGQTYGLEAYAGQAIAVVLLEGFCTFCRSNSLVAETLQNNLAAEGLAAQIVILGDGNAKEFASRVGLPIFRDGDGAAWSAMRPGASKHDTFVFAPNGERTFFWQGSYQGDATRWTEEVGAALRAVAPAR